MPEITEEALSLEIHEAGIRVDEESFWKQWRCIFGFVAQTAYVYVVIGPLSLESMRLTKVLQGCPGRSCIIGGQLFSRTEHRYRPLEGQPVVLVLSTDVYLRKVRRSGNRSALGLLMLL